MTAEKELFINLLSSFVNQTEPCGKKVDYGEVFRLAEIHDVGGIIGSQIKLLSDEYKPDDKYKSYFNQALGYTVKNNEIRRAAYTKIKDFLNKNEINHIFVKGIILKDYYPVPELRTSGDIDVIVDREIPEIKALTDREDFKFVSSDANTVTVNIYGVDIEIHNKADVFSEYFDDIFSLCEKEGYEYKLTFSDHLFYVVCHLAKHLVYRGAGVRMLLDIDVMIRRCEDSDIERLIAQCKTNGLEKSVEVILSLCKLWFNTPVNSYVDLNEDEELLDKLEQIFLDGGSFGFFINMIPLKYYKDNPSKVKIFFKLAFPSKDYLKKCYPYYENNGLLYPVARVNRLFDGLFKRNKVAKSALMQIFDGNQTNTQLELIKELDINIKE